jgi:ADP-ribosylglycohydrolase
MTSRIPSKEEYRSRITGLLLGMAVGDALGLPYEGLSRRRSMRMLGPPDRFRFLFGRGMISDDTEHACMTAQAVLRFPTDQEKFLRTLAWKLRWWLVALPAGTGWATARALLKLWVGFPPDRSGVFSAGNGPALRAPVIGACLGRFPEILGEYARTSTRLTHRDTKAEKGAMVVALAAGACVREGAAGLDPIGLSTYLVEQSGDDELGTTLERVAHGLKRGWSVQCFTDDMGLGKGVSGYIYHTVPVAIYAFLKNLGDFEMTVREVVALGGDADSTGAVAGALAGAAVGVDGIPSRWLEGLAEWPRSVRYMSRLGGRLAILASGEDSPGPEPLFWPGLLPRNVLFLLAVLTHGFRRMLPPY